MPEAAPLKVLVVDDNRSAADGLAMVLRKLGDDVTAVYGGEDAIRALTEDPPDVVLTDLRMEPVDGMAVLAAARQVRPPIECIVLTAYGAVETAVEAIQVGARDFLTKPVAVEQVRARLDELRDPTPTWDAQSPPDFVAEAEASKRLVESLQQAATVPARVWIEGDVGSGRVHSAKLLHTYANTDSPFTILDPARLESWPGEGTVVLPNVDDLPDDIQSHLKRQLATLPDSVRVISTASRESRERVRRGDLRSDLYYDLAVITITVPSLSERIADVVPLFERAVAALSVKYQRPSPALNEDIRRGLTAYHWPGNVRELLNMAERAVVLGVTRPPNTWSRSSEQGIPPLEDGFNLSQYLEDTERRILSAALRKCNGDRNAVGRLLGVERNTLRYKLNKFGLLDK